jgi:CDP-diacylglycerol--glycerol-3-phosphate 3-phosphatidyltransferase
MVAATLILLCTRPLKVPALAQAPWLLIVPSITIIGREVIRYQAFYSLGT